MTKRLLVTIVLQRLLLKHLIIRHAIVSYLMAKFSFCEWNFSRNKRLQSSRFCWREYLWDQMSVFEGRRKTDTPFGWRWREDSKLASRKKEHLWCRT